MQIVIMHAFEIVSIILHVQSIKTGVSLNTLKTTTGISIR